MPAPFSFDRSFEFAVPAETLWSAVTRVSEFPTWWTWLAEFETDGPDGNELEPGVTASCVVRPPLPYELRFAVTVLDIEPGHLVRTHVDGDLVGPAVLEVGPHSHDPGASTARLTWEVGLTPPALRVASTVARPLMIWGHEWVVRLGVTQFRERAFGGE